MIKYKGSITHRSDGKYEARITEIPLYKTFHRRVEAEDFIRKKNVEHDLVRNKITLAEEEGGGDSVAVAYKCDLRNGKEMIFDEDDVGIVNSRLFWYENGVVVSRDKESGRRITFSSLVAPPITEEQQRQGYKLHHINKNRLDYRKSNLRWTSPHNIKIDARGFRNNRSTGLMGITKRAQVLRSGNTQTRFIVQWNENGMKKSKSFGYKNGDDEGEQKALQEAKSYRKNVLLLQ